MSGLTSSLGNMGSWLTSLGSSAMAPLLAFSDRRLKTNIQPIGTTFDGQTLYRFKYIGKDDWTIGLMADEVDPRFVEEDAAGYKMVDYERALQEAAELGMEAHHG